MQSPHRDDLLGAARAVELELLLNLMPTRMESLVHTQPHMLDAPVIDKIKHNVATDLPFHRSVGQHGAQQRRDATQGRRWDGNLDEEVMVGG